MKHDQVKGGKADKLTLKDLVTKHDSKGYYDPQQFLEELAKQLEIGIAVEREHTNNDKLAEEIALDHLFEKANYYSQLVEKDLVDEPGALKVYSKYFGKLKKLVEALQKLTDKKVSLEKRLN